MKTTEELRKLDKAALAKELESMEEEHFHEKFEVANGNSKNSHLISKKRKQIARIKTIQNESTK